MCLLVVPLVVFLNHMFLCHQLVWKQQSFKRVRPCRKDTHDRCDRCGEKTKNIKKLTHTRSSKPIFLVLCRSLFVCSINSTGDQFLHIALFNYSYHLCIGLFVKEGAAGNPLPPRLCVDECWLIMLILALWKQTLYSY